MSPSGASPMNHRLTRRAFSLVEILIVVALIAILIAILVPSLVRARSAARKADTTHLLSMLQNACEAYFQVFNDYPGPVPETSLGAANAITGAQNLYIGLVGRISNTGEFGSDGVSLSGSVTAASNPETSNTIRDLATGQGYASFYKPRAGDTAFPQGTATPLPNIKVFFDRYANPMPIVYFRRTRSVERPVVNTVDVSTPAAYYRQVNAPFFQATALQSITGQTVSQATSGYNSANLALGLPNTFFDSHLELPLTNTGVELAYTNTPAAVRAARKAQGNYTLMSPGADGIFGPVIDNGRKVADSDDVVVYSP